MKDITNIAVTGEDGVVTYADGSKEEFQCSGTVATIIASLATTLEKERKMRIATGDRLRRMYTRDSDMISRGLNGTSATSTAPTAMNAEFMRLVRAVAPKYDSALPDADPASLRSMCCATPLLRRSAPYTLPQCQKSSWIRLSIYSSRLATT